MLTYDVAKSDRRHARYRGRRERHHARQGRQPIDRRQFAEQLTGADIGQDHIGTTAGWHPDPDQPAHDEEDVGAVMVSVQDQGPRLEAAPGAQPLETVYLLPVQPPEQREARQRRTLARGSPRRPNPRSSVDVLIHGVVSLGHLTLLSFFLKDS